MGIQQFLSSLKKTCNIISIKEHILDKKWDLLIFDVHCILYTIYNIFQNEINFLLRLIFRLQYLFKYDQLKFNIEINNYKSIINYIKLTHILYFNKIFGNVDIYFDNLINGININNALNFDFNDENIIIDYLIEEAINQIIKISNNHLSCIDNFNKTFIFFDGIPSNAKIKEQISRRIPSEIIKIINLDILNKSDICSEKIIRKKLLNNNPPSIGINSILIINLKEKLMLVNDKIKGKFYVNSKSKYGEAEHQIMNYINNNDLFKNKKILLVSPDSDLILLSMINYTKGYYIDIYRDDFSKETNKEFYSYDKLKIKSPFYRIYDYIFIEDVIKKLNLNSNHEILDISYILLLIGDDYLPSIPSLNSSFINLIINIYKKINKKIIYIEDNIYKLDIIIFSTLLYELSINEDNREYNNITLYNENLKKSLIYLRNLYNYKKNLYHLDEFTDFENNDYLFWLMLYLENGAYFDFNSDIEKSLFNNIDTISTYSNNDKQIINYLEGCNFILELYINNNIKNYNWIYKYKTVPKLIEIHNFIKNNIDNIYNIFDFNNHLSDKYLDLENYEKYFKYLKDKIIFNKLINISKNIKSNVKIYDFNFKSKIKDFFTYDKIQFIFDTDKKIFFNKCIDIEIYDIPESFLYSIVE